jgi:cell wall assembly regulator SMI1
MSITRTWDRIHDWLGAHAPALFERLSAGATDAQLAAAERAMGLTLPRDLRESLRIHDGAEPDFPFAASMDLLSLNRIVSEWQLMTRLLDEGHFARSTAPTDGPVKGDWWNRRWVPVTQGYVGQSFHFLDLDPAAGGSVGQVAYFDKDPAIRSVEAPSFAAWLAGFADDLEAGRYKATRVSLEDAERFNPDDFEPDDLL